MSYSQDREEEFITAFFGGRVERFLDVGAHDGRTFSNTLRLVEQGWTGVCVEPAASVFASLLANHRDRAGIQLVNAALAAKREIIPFWDSNGDCIGTTEIPNRDLWAKSSGVKFSKTWIQTLASDDFFAAFPGPYQFISIDVEGTSKDLLLSFPIAALGVELICVEHDGHKAEIEAHCRALGFDRFEEVGCNLMVSR